MVPILKTRKEIIFFFKPETIKDLVPVWQKERECEINPF